jgi:hypothetical protein
VRTRRLRCCGTRPTGASGEASLRDSASAPGRGCTGASARARPPTGGSVRSLQSPRSTQPHSVSPLSPCRLWRRSREPRVEESLLAHLGRPLRIAARPSGAYTRAGVC